MAEAVSAVVSEILAQGSFDLTSTEALRILNRRHKEMNRRARINRNSVAATYSGATGSSGVYRSTAALVELLQIQVGNSTDWSHTRRADVGAMIEGTLVLSGPGGVFVEFGVGLPDLTAWLLYPDPGAAAVVTIYGVYEPSDLLINDTVPFVCDPDMVEGLMAGVFATALARPGEARPDLAAQQEQIFQAACDEQKRIVDRRYRGRGPATIRLHGLVA